MSATQEFRFVSAFGESIGSLWGPSAGVRSRGCVLVCHGGSGHRLAADIVATATELASTCEVHVATIDGPVHGQHSPYPDDRDRVIEDFRRLWRAGDGAVDRAVADWSAAVDALRSRADVPTERLAWYGVSMGTGYGIPVIASTPAIAGAVLGMWSFEYPGSERIRLAAPDVRCPVQFHVRTEDQLFSLADQTVLFEALGADRKELLAYPGPHAAPPPEQLRAAGIFLTQTVFA
ncbi:MAG: dienelactone hydrolase family protein [Ilumatobacteraceae bacterium]